MSELLEKLEVEIPGLVPEAVDSVILGLCMMYYYYFYCCSCCYFSGSCSELHSLST